MAKAANNPKPLVRGNEPPHSFKRYPLGEGQSVASSLLGSNRRGIYIYRFSDGTWYVGKSVDVVKRHGQHLHDYRHDPEFEGLAITDVWFMEVGPALGDAFLNEQETATIKYADRAGWDLHNEQKTGHPHGNEDFEAVLEGSETLAFPWERPTSPKWALGPSARLGQEDSSSVAWRLSRLRGAGFYGELREAVDEYLRLTVHEAAATAGFLWSVSALPSTNGGYRLFTASVSSLETLYAFGHVDGDVDLIHVNCKRPDGSFPAPPLLAGTGRPARVGYGACGGVRCFEFRSIAAFRAALRNERFLDWCWRLNIEMMRKSPTLHTKGFCTGLARDLLGLGGGC